MYTITAYQRISTAFIASQFYLDTHMLVRMIHIADINYYRDIVKLVQSTVILIRCIILLEFQEEIN
jgi:hypothetical protein